jgi:hypothetical protein
MIVCEEGLEMTGVLLFTRALLLHVTDTVGVLELALTPQVAGVARREVDRAGDGWLDQPKVGP